MKKLLVFLLLIWTLVLNAAPYNGEIMRFRQPDGTSVDVKLFGNEYYMRAEDLNGYTLIRDESSHWICYANLSANGKELVSTGIQYHGTRENQLQDAIPAQLPMHLDISEKAVSSIIHKNQIKLGIDPHIQPVGKTDPHPVLGEVRGLCIVVDFSDEPGSEPITEFENFCNSMTYNNFGNNGSLRKYYYDISGGLVDYQNVVYGYYRAPLTFAEYEQMNFGTGAQQILNLALNWIASQGFDFSTLSLNPDNSIQAINLMYTGVAQTWSAGMWWHSGYYGGFSANGVTSGSYNTSPAFSPLSIATVAHENGHMIGKWPDTYKYNNTTGPDGIGRFDLMCATGDSYNPVLPNPYFRSNAGWGNTIDVTYFNGQVSDTAESNTFRKYFNLNDTNEFFMIETRQQTGRSQGIPDQGLTIWHIDRNGDNQTTHHEVYLEHANNDIQNHDQACFHSGFNNEFSFTSTPSSSLYNGNPSGLRVWDIGPVNNVMTYKLGTGQPSPAFFLQYVNITGDNNANGFLESGETANVNITAANLGQLISGNATVACAAFGINAYAVTVNTPAINLGSVNVSQSLPATFNISILNNVPLGTEVELQFTITDGTFTATLNRKFILGVVVLIGEQQVTGCQSVFYDHGGPNGSYLNNTDYSTTFYPGSPNQKVSAQFTLFDLESSTNCIYDYLNIYNGPGTNSPLIGKYCGTTSPGVVVSTDPTGALTFQFHSDEGVTGAGWKALVTCSGSSNVTEPENHSLSVIPNPSANGIFTLSFNQIVKSQIVVTDLLGKVVLKLEDEGPQTQINLEDQPDGIYYLSVQSGTMVPLFAKLLKFR